MTPLISKCQSSDGEGDSVYREQVGVGGGFDIRKSLGQENPSPWWGSGSPSLFYCPSVTHPDQVTPYKFLVLLRAVI